MDLQFFSELLRCATHKPHRDYFRISDMYEPLRVLFQKLLMQFSSVLKQFF